MLPHYLKLIFRIFYKQKIYFLISLSGMIIAFSVSFLIITYVSHELSINRGYMNYHRIYSVKQHWIDKDSWNILTPGDVGPAIKSFLPEVEGMTRVFMGNVFIQQGNEKVKAKMLFADPDFFDIFTNRSGINRNVSLTDLNCTVFTRQFVGKYFKDTLSIGESIDISIGWDNKRLTVTDIIEGFDRSSSIQADLIGHMDLFLKIMDNPIWKEQSVYGTFILLPDNVNEDEVNRKIEKVISKQLGHPKFIRYETQKFDDFYLNPHNVDMSFYPSGNFQNIKWFSITAILLLFIAVINFCILSTANAMNRHKEFGIRKTFGSGRSGVRLQALSESTLMALIALPAAIILSEISLPLANNFWNQEIDFNILHHGGIMVMFLSISLITGVLSGLYLSFYIGRINPVVILQSKFKSKNAIGFRKILIMSQIFIFVVLFSFSFLIGKQFHYFLNRDMGYDPENILCVSYDPKDPFLETDSVVMVSKIETLRQKLDQYPSIENVSFSTMNALPWFDNMIQSTAAWKNDSPEEKYVIMVLGGDKNIVSTLDLKLTKGMGWYENTRNGILLNEAAVKLLGYSDPVGEKIILAGGEVSEIVGVVENFNSQSFRKKIAPLIIDAYKNPNHIRNIYIKYSPGDIKEMLHYIESGMKEIFPGYTFEFSFLEDRIKNLYGNEKKLSQTINIGTLLILIIAAMGLFAISLYEAGRRTREIGIRKVNGASTKDILILLSKDLTITILISFLLAIPTSLYIMKLWLQNFIFQTTVSWWIFGLTGIIALLIGWITTGCESYIAARRNPVEVLRYE